MTGQIDGTTSDDEEKLTEALQDINASRRPIVVLGSLAARRGLDSVWNELRVPCFTTAAAKGAVSEKGSFAGGIITGEISQLSPENSVAYQSADLVVGIGLRNTEMINPEFPQVALVMFDELTSACHGGFAPSRVIRCRDIRSTSGLVRDVLRGKDWGEQEIAEYWGRVDASIMTSEWLPGPIYRHVQHLLGDDTILVLDTGFFCTIGESVWKAQRPADFQGSSIGRFMGIGIPTAIGSAISSKRKVVCVVGDG
ncbi:MAG: thiamine pyrophosphate-dependent enzyme, partial [Candidatus Krumholzibacteria bacterium]|nr:thiamine pyrophosphate-dependent enzyme [Candidatus Krumholzibacteria bacterium]